MCSQCYSEGGQKAHTHCGTARQKNNKSTDHLDDQKSPGRPRGGEMNSLVSHRSSASSFMLWYHPLRLGLCLGYLKYEFAKSRLSALTVSFCWNFSCITRNAHYKDAEAAARWLTQQIHRIGFSAHHLHLGNSPLVRQPARKYDFGYSHRFCSRSDLCSMYCGNTDHHSCHGLPFHRYQACWEKSQLGGLVCPGSVDLILRSFFCSFME